MRHRLTIFISTCIVILNPYVALTQELHTHDSTNTRLIKIAREIMISADVCVLITLDENGQPRSRLMDAFPPESDMVVWFGTNRKSRKVIQISANNRVTLFYQDPDKSGYVSIHGKAELVDRQEEKSKWWKEEWEDFYTNRKEDYLLIKVSPEWLEVLSYPHGITGDSITWQPPGVLFDD
ncbi:pyridoxamine 5'-phosphate oxidase family protein [Bacteroidota bacterium]